MRFLFLFAWFPSLPTSFIWRWQMQTRLWDGKAVKKGAKVCSWMLLKHLMRKKRRKNQTPDLYSDSSWSSSHIPNSSVTAAGIIARTQKHTRSLISPTFQLSVSQYTALNPSSSSAVVCGSDWIITHM